MMSSENIPPVAHPPENHHTTHRKSTSQKTQEQPLPQPPPLKCPRCDSSNTKFCYYNNYSLTQPRHFCKTCRRYWTKGGALRNVPIGGGCRKTKKHKPTSSSSSSITRLDISGGPGTVSDFKFLAQPNVTPAMEFQLGGLALPRLHPATAGVYTQFITSSGTQTHSVGLGSGSGGCFGLDLLGLGNYPPIPTSSNDHNISISSIESLSSINQEMHWKLQQQRLGLLYGPTTIEDDHNNQEKAIGEGEGMDLFKNLENARKIDHNQVSGDHNTPNNNPTEWLFEQIPVNYGSSDKNNNNHEDFNGVWATELHSHHHQHQFNGLQ
ncbi:unnamed protein product [Amaranthus hypochondriacus]